MFNGQKYICVLTTGVTQPTQRQFFSEKDVEQGILRENQAENFHPAGVFFLGCGNVLGTATPGFFLKIPEGGLYGKT